jgi:hypothetical protein
LSLTHYGDPVICDDKIDEWAPGRSYALHPLIDSRCTAGKFVLSTRDGQYESMIPWVQPSLKSPAYAMS